MRIMTVIACMFFLLPLKGQDPYFSQYYNAATYLNPALTGAFDGGYKLSLAYRDQWSSLLDDLSFKTYFADFQYRIGVGGSDVFTIGFDMLGDQAGRGRFRQTLAHLSLSYKMKLSSNYSSGDQYLIAGATAGGGQNSINWSNLWFGRQFDLNSQLVDPNLSSGENLGDDKLGTGFYPDLNLGILWYSVLSHNHSFYGGAALHHINSPNVSLTDTSISSLYRRLTLHGGAELPLSEQMSILPHLALVFQGPSFQSNFGGSLRFRNADWEDLTMRFGLSSRISKTYDGMHMDAIILSTMMELGNLHMGLSYDVTMSDLSSINTRRGAFEITLIYTSGKPKRRRAVGCPNF